MGLLATIVGTLAGIGTTVSFTPQVVHMFRAKTAGGVSPLMLLIHFTGVSLWTWYGFMLDNAILIVFNVVTVILVLLCIIRYIQLSRLVAPAPKTGIGIEM